LCVLIGTMVQILGVELGDVLRLLGVLGGITALLRFLMDSPSKSDFRDFKTDINSRLDRVDCRLDGVAGKLGSLNVGVVVLFVGVCVLIIMAIYDSVYA